MTTDLIKAGLLLAVLLLIWKKWCKKPLRWMIPVLLPVGAVISVFLFLQITEGQTITVRAAHQKNRAAEGMEVWIKSVTADGKEYAPEDVFSSGWLSENGYLKWRNYKQPDGMTDSISAVFPAGADVDILFETNKWRGIAEVQEGKWFSRIYQVDCYSDSETVDRNWVSYRTSRTSSNFHVSGMIKLLCLLVLLCAMYAVKKTTGKKETAVRPKSGKWNAILNDVLNRIKRYQFLFEELVKRDFKKKYKRTVLGMAWSLLSPLLTLLVMRIVFTQFFGRNMEHYTTYLFCGNLVFSYFNESTSQGMTSLTGNASIFTRVNVPKYLFLFSKNVQTLINFGLTLIIFFIFCVLDHITFTWRFIFLLYPVVTLLLFNIGMGLILSALFVFFRDVQYLWSVFTQLLMYLSAVFYTIEQYSAEVQDLFLLNPIYLHIRYFRKIVIEASVPSAAFHFLMLLDVLAVLWLGCRMYKKYNTRFLYYV